MKRLITFLAAAAFGTAAIAVACMPLRPPRTLTRRGRD